MTSVRYEVPAPRSKGSERWRTDSKEPNSSSKYYISASTDSLIFQDKSESEVFDFTWMDVITAETGQASVTGDILSELELNKHSTAITTALLISSTKYSLSERKLRLNRGLQCERFYQ